MKIEHIAHATISLTLEDGRHIVIDPYLSRAFYGRFAYPPYRSVCDYVLVTHDHLDHNYLGDLSGHFTLVRHDYQGEGLRVVSHRVWHDKQQGTRFGGAVDMKLIEVEGLRILHMGDCGEILTDVQIEALGQLDIVFIPVGGHYTIDALEAFELMHRMWAKTYIPIHYKTPYLRLPMAELSDFLRLLDGYHCMRESKLSTVSMPSGVVLLSPRYGAVL